MANTDELLRQGIALVKAGQKPQARTVLEQVVDMDDQNVQAWLWLSACVDTVEDQQVCLENVLALDPGNDKARRGLDALKNMNKPRPRVPESAPVADPFAMGGSNGGAVGMGWDDYAAPVQAAPSPANPEVDVPATSVDWGKGSAPAHGSGKQVQLPSSEEYDDWMANLPLAPASETSLPIASPANANAFGNFGDFGDFAAEFNSDGSGSKPQINVQTSQPSGGGFGAATGGSDPFGGDDPFGLATNKPAAQVSAPVQPSASPFGDSFDFGSFDTPTKSAGSKSADPFGSTGSAAFDSGPFGMGTSAPADDPFSSTNANFEGGFNRPGGAPAANVATANTSAGGSKSLFDEPFDFGGFAAPATPAAPLPPAANAGGFNLPTSSARNQPQPAVQGDSGLFGDFDDPQGGSMGGDQGIFGAPVQAAPASSPRIRYDAMPDTFDTGFEEDLPDTRGASELLGGSGLFQDTEPDPYNRRASVTVRKNGAISGAGLFGGDSATGFAALPAELQVRSGGGNRVGTMLLLLLNVLALAFLAYNFIR